MGAGDSPVGNPSGGIGQGHGSHGLGTGGDGHAGDGAGATAASSAPGAQDGAQPATGIMGDDRLREPDVYRSANAHPATAWDLAQRTIGAANLELTARGGDPNGAPGSVGTYAPRGWSGKVIHALWAVTGIISAWGLGGLVAKIARGVVAAVQGARALGFRGLLRLIPRIPAAALAAARALPRRVAATVVNQAKSAAKAARAVVAAAARMARSVRLSWNSFVAKMRGGIVVDTNILSRIAASDAEALRFANRNAGRLYVNETVIDEFVARNGRPAYQKLADDYGVRELRMSESHARAMMNAAGVSSPGRYADFTVLSTASQHGLSIVTGDSRLIAAALRGGMTEPGQVLGRIFEGSAQARVAWYQRMRSLIPQWAPDASPTAVTGSPIGR